MGVEDEYNALLLPNAKAYLDWEIQNTPDASLVSVQATRFRGLPATEATFRSAADGKQNITHELIAFRKTDDLVYTIRLVTDPSNYSLDLALFKQIQSGFHVFPVNDSGCVNQ